MNELNIIHPLAEEFNFFSDDNPIFCILLVHGFTASPSEIKPLGKFLFDFFDKKINVYSILLPGHGVNGEEGYKTLDNIKYEEWLLAFHKKINKIALENKNSPIFLCGLSMGSAIICDYLLNGKEKKNISGAILLSIPLFIKSRVFSFVWILKYLTRYQAKGKDATDFFLKYNLFSYPIRSVRSVNEFRKLINLTRRNFQHITTPTIGFLAEKDEWLNIPKIFSFLNQFDHVIIQQIPDLGHIFTVYEEAKPYFKKICEWIQFQLATS